LFMSTLTNRAVVVGGGIAGLSAAYYLQQQGGDYTLLEASDRFGGLVYTERVDSCLVEYGPDAFITRKPWALDLAKSLGLEDDLIPVNPTPERIYVLVNGRLVPLPDGLRLLVPTKLGPFLNSALLSPWGKLRVLLDQVISAKSDDADESLADFVRRRMGQEALERLADPLLGGVYNAEMERQSILATFPQYRQIEAKHGSLIRGMQAASQSAPKSETPPLLSFKGGMGQLVDKLVQSLSGDLCLNTSVERIASENGNYRLTLADGDVLNTSHLVLATPANVSARLLADVAPDAADGLSQIRYEGVGSMSLAYHRADVPHPLDAYGVVIPARENRPIDGMQWSSSKWPGRALEDFLLIRVFFGGPHTRQMLEYDDDTLLEVVQRELRSILGIGNDPFMMSVRRWRNAYPQYDVGHIERVAAIEHAVSANIKLAGNAYHGVGLPDTIRTGKVAAESLGAMLSAKM
jgi:oxygen-dependent protoporphyrinogen oxidase